MILKVYENYRFRGALKIYFKGMLYFFYLDCKEVNLRDYTPVEIYIFMKSKNPNFVSFLLKQNSLLYLICKVHEIIISLISKLMIYYEETLSSFLCSKRL